MTALERTPYKERPRRSTDARTNGFCFKVTDDESDGENEDEDEESVEKLSPRVSIENAERRTQRILTEGETVILTNDIIELVESKIKPYQNTTVQHNIRSKVIEQLSSKSNNTTSLSLLCEIQKPEDCISPRIVIPSSPQSQNESVAERDRMIDSLLKSLLVEPYNLVSYRYLQAVLVEGLSTKNINTLKYVACDKTNEDRKERALFGRRAISSAKDDYKQIVKIGKPLVMKKRSIQRYSEEQLTYTIKFILHEDNVCLFAWGSRKKSYQRNR